MLIFSHSEMRRLFETIRKLVERRYQNTDVVYENRDLQWQSVSAFCFLRFIVPAILHPHLFGLCPGLPSQPVQRSLTLIAKVIQSLANLNTVRVERWFMVGNVLAYSQTDCPERRIHAWAEELLERQFARHD